MVKVFEFEDFREMKRRKSLEGGIPFFQSPFYWKVFGENFCKKEEILLLGVLKKGELVGYGAFERRNDKAFFLGMRPILGGEEVTDYGDVFIKGDRELWLEGWRKILNWLKKNGAKKIQLDYVRGDSISLKIFKDGTFFPNVKVLEQEVSVYIKLPESWDKYLENLTRKRRKEIRRKIRRLEEIRSFHFCTEETMGYDFEEFVRLCRLSSGAKKKFMSEEMKQFFWDLVRRVENGWEAKICFLKIKGKNAAGVMSFESKEEVLVYNSGYNPKFSFYSAGFLLKAFKIKRAIKEKKKIIDFMRGRERYKYDLGGKELKLYKIEVDVA